MYFLSQICNRKLRLEYKNSDIWQLVLVCHKEINTVSEVGIQYFEFDLIFYLFNQKNACFTCLSYDAIIINFTI